MSNIIEALIRLLLKALFPELLELALAVVTEIQNDPAVLTNEQKRTLAYERIKAKLKEGEKDLSAVQQAGAKDSVIIM